MAEEALPLPPLPTVGEPAEEAPTPAAVKSPREKKSKKGKSSSKKKHSKSSGHKDREKDKDKEKRGDGGDADAKQHEELARKYKKKARDAEARTAELESEQAATVKDLEEAQKKVGSLSVELAEAQASVATLAKEVESLREQLNTTEASRVALESEKEAAVASLKSVADEKAQLEQKLIEANANVQDTASSGDVDTLRSETESLKKQLAAMKKRAEDAEAAAVKANKRAQLAEVSASVSVQAQRHSSQFEGKSLTKTGAPPPVVPRTALPQAAKALAQAGVQAAARRSGSIAPPAVPQSAPPRETARIEAKHEAKDAESSSVSSSSELTDEESANETKDVPPPAPQEESEEEDVPPPIPTMPSKSDSKEAVVEEQEDKESPLPSAEKKKDEAKVTKEEEEDDAGSDDSSSGNYGLLRADTLPQNTTPQTVVERFTDQPQRSAPSPKLPPGRQQARKVSAPKPVRGPAPAPHAVGPAASKTEAKIAAANVSKGASPPPVAARRPLRPSAGSGGSSSSVLYSSLPNPHRAHASPKVSDLATQLAGTLRRAPQQPPPAVPQQRVSGGSTPPPVAPRASYGSSTTPPPVAPRKGSAAAFTPPKVKPRAGTGTPPMVQARTSSSPMIVRGTGRAERTSSQPLMVAPLGDGGDDDADDASDGHNHKSNEAAPNYGFGDELVIGKVERGIARPVPARRDVKARERSDGGKSKVKTLHGAWAACAEQNTKHKSYMEDAYACVPDFMPNSAFFGVYDGHSGRDAADYCVAQLHVNVRLAIEQGMAPLEALAAGFVATDEDLRALQVRKAGTTAVACVLQKEGSTRHLFVANVGDARAVLAVKGSNKGYTAVRLSYDHKVEDEAEKKRVEALGATLLWGKLQGQLMVTRALGDHDLKRFVVPVPHKEARKLEKSKQNPYLILACDGIFDVMSDQDVVDVCTKGAQQPNAMAARIVDAAIKLNSKDNLTALVVAL